MCNKKCNGCNDCETNAIKAMQQRGIKLFKCIVECKDFTLSSMIFTYDEMIDSFNNYPYNFPEYRRYTGYYKIIECSPM